MTEPTDRVSRFLRPRPIGRLAVAVTVAAALFVIGLFIGVGVAHAQTPPRLAAPPPPCWPSYIGGSGEGFMFGGDEATGQWFGGWCELPGEPRGQWRKWAVVALHGYVIQHPSKTPSVSALQLASAYWTLNVAQDVPDATDPRRVALWAAAMTALDGTKPAPIAATAWIVTPALSGSRPLFSIVNGALVATTQRVAALASPATACDCAAAKLVIAPSTYCAPVGKAPLVALCRMK